MTKVIVVGGGHAGVEAALALAKKGIETSLITLNISHIAKMPCNPSVGGPAKGIVVRDLDALGGVMPKVADKTALQFKMLNTAKGPGVWSLRVQSDKLAYSKMMQDLCLKQENLEVIEDVVDGLLTEKDTIKGVYLRDKGELLADYVLLTTGTYMDSLVMISSEVKSSGPDGDNNSSKLSENLKELGFDLMRLKTGTPPRILTSSIDFSKTSEEKGSEETYSFSIFSKDLLPYDKQWPCYLTYTNEETHRIIKENIHLSSMYSGVVKGIGPRYCPSIEDKIVRFADKSRHQLFLEPESKDLDTTYIQGFSSSLPREVQELMVHSLKGLENAVIKKYAYAIEYDSFNPLDIKFNLETKKIKNLFVAGQILGTSGYEEAAGLGMVAAYNIAAKIENRENFILRRDESYIGVMIDDLLTKGTKEPYRLLTSRAEYRLLLRHDNAWERLSDKSFERGFISKEEYESFKEKLNAKKELLNKIESEKVGGEALNEYLKSKGYKGDKGGYLLSDLAKRPDLDLKTLLSFANIESDDERTKEAEIECKYEGYISKARQTAERMHSLEKKKLPEDIDYLQVDNLRIEARQKLNEVKPSTLGQAARISGINPADVQVLAMLLKRKNDKH